MRRFVVAVVAVLMWPMVAGAQTPAATPAAVSCGNWQGYRAAMVEEWKETTSSADAYEAVSRLFGVTFSDYAMIPAPYLRDSADVLDRYALALAGVDGVPFSLQPLHDLYLGRIVLISHYTRANADGDVWGIAFYADRITDNQEEIASQVEVLRASCPAAWSALTNGRRDPFPLMWTDWNAA